MPTALPLDQGKLSSPLAQQYWQDGYLFPLQVVSQTQAAAWRTQLEQLEKDWLDNGLPLPLNTYKRVNSHVVIPMSVEIAKTPAVLDAVEGLLGPDILIYSVEYFIKEPRTKHVVTMHQDLTYWGMGEIDNIITAWVALSDVSVASGCMDFVQGSHKNPILPHEDSFDQNNLLSRGQEIVVKVADKDKVPVELSPGQMSLHHGLTIHGSAPNVSDDRRIGAVIRYISPHVVKPVGPKDYGIPARGNCDTGKWNLFDGPSELFDEAAQKRYVEIRDLQTKIMMSGAAKASNIYEKG